MRRLGLLLATTTIVVLVVASQALAYRTVAPPPPWLAANAHEMTSRAASALGVDYNYGKEAWEAQVGSADEGPDCSGFVQKVWELPDTIWYREEDGDFPCYLGSEHKLEQHEIHGGRLLLSRNLLVAALICKPQEG